MLIIEQRPKRVARNSENRLTSACMVAAFMATGPLVCTFEFESTLKARDGVR